MSRGADRRRAALAALAALPLLLLVSACKDDGGSAFDFPDSDSGGGSGVAAQASTAPSTANSGSASGGTASAQKPDLTEFTGRWTGTYTCSQGQTSLTFKLAGGNLTVAGTFEFTTTDGTSGSYTVTSEPSDPKVVLHAGQWVNQPDGYDMVDFEVTTITSTTISGTVDGNGCTTFQATKS